MGVSLKMWVLVRECRVASHLWQQVRVLVFENNWVCVSEAVGIGGGYFDGIFRF